MVVLGKYRHDAGSTNRCTSSCRAQGLCPHETHHMEEAESLPPLSQPGHRLVVNSLLNAIGQGVPILVAIGSVPLLLRGLGTERTGLLTLSWSVIGYASLFDFG